MAKYRYSLRNKDKIISSLGSDYYNLLIKSLTDYFSETDEIQEHKYEYIDNPVIHVPSGQLKSEAIFEFVIIKKQFNVYNLAYYSAIN